MYAVIEFDKKQCSVLPLSWLVEDQEFCFWPKNISQETFDEMVKMGKPPNKSWAKYKVIKLLNISEKYQEAATYLEKYIDENSCSTSDNANGSSLQQITKKDIDDSDFDSDSDINQFGPRNEPPHKRKKTDVSLKNSGRDGTRASSEEFSSDDDIHSLNTSISTVTAHSETTSTFMSNVTPTSPISEKCLSHSGNTSKHSDLILERILRQVECIRAVQDQQSIKLDMIERNQQTSVIQQLQRPATMPALPVSNKQEYKSLEEFLVDDNNSLYMRRRLAAIGGSSVRNSVMNILKFVLTNKVAQKFNWSGREKRPFHNTRIMHVINEAVKLSYSGREPSDLTDTVISSAVKDWLKLAKYRYNYSKSSRRSSN